MAIFIDIKNKLKSRKQKAEISNLKFKIRKLPRKGAKGALKIKQKAESRKQKF
jgi:hypothetical protein